MGNSFRQTIAAIFADPRMSVPTMLEGHRRATLERAAAAGGQYLIAVQDSTYYNYTGHTCMQGLGGIQGNIKGIIQHNVLLLDEGGLPLGLIDQQYWSRGGTTDLQEKESIKWSQGLQAVATHLKDSKKRTILVQDREADIFSFFKEGDQQLHTDLLVRVHQPRNIESVESGQVAKLAGYKDMLAVRGKMEVTVGRRNRSVRLTLALQACRVHLLPDKDKSAARHKTMPLSLVIAREVDAVDEQGNRVYDEKEAALWYLVTRLPVDTTAEIERIVYYYSLRWRIERFHLTLKSGGLNVEKLQFDDLQTTINALAFYSVVGWQLLCLTYLLRARQQEEAEKCFEAGDLEVLRRWGGKPIRTVGEAAAMLGRVVGFVPTKKQPLPGVKILTEALERLYYLKTGYQLTKT